MIPAWLAWPVIKKFMGGLPWGKILIGLAVAGVLFSIGLYIRSSEKAKAELVTVKAENAALVEANAALEASYKNKIAVMQDSIKKSIEREKTYASAIEEIQAQPVTACARSSPALHSSIRLLRQRNGD